MKKRAVTVKLRKQLQKILSEKYKIPNIGWSKKDQLFEGVLPSGSVIFVNNQPFFIIREKEILPHLKLLQKYREILPVIMVDQGALKFLLKGADVMRPGIMKFFHDFNKGDVVCVIEERSKSPILIGRALLSRAEMEELEKGKVIESLHHLGDEFWKAQLT